MLRLCSYACAYVALYVAGVTAFFVLPYAYATSVNQASETNEWPPLEPLDYLYFFLYRQYNNFIYLEYFPSRLNSENLPSSHSRGDHENENETETIYQHGDN